MARTREVHWRDQLDIIDFSVIRIQMARELGVRPRMIAECDVRARMKKVHEADEAALLRVYPQYGDRPRRIGIWPHRKK